MLEITGHADYADKGADIVCSAISILAYTLEKAAETLPEREVRRVVHFKDGYVTFMFQGGEETSKEAADKLDTIVGMALMGYRLLAESYPNNIRYYITREV